MKQGTDQTRVAHLSTDLPNTHGLAVDWVSRNLFWTSYDANKRQINVARLDGSFKNAVIQGLDKPHCLVLHPILGLVVHTHAHADVHTVKLSHTVTLKLSDPFLISLLTYSVYLQKWTLTQSGSQPYLCMRSKLFCKQQMVANLWLFCHSQVGFNFCSLMSSFLRCCSFSVFLKHVGRFTVCDYSLPVSVSFCHYFCFSSVFFSVHIRSLSALF